MCRKFNSIDFVVLYIPEIKSPLIIQYVSQ